MVVGAEEDWAEVVGEELVGAEILREEEVGATVSSHGRFERWQSQTWPS